MTLARYTSKIVGIPYKLGGMAGENGADCFNTIWAYLSERINLPVEYEGLTIDTYAELYERDPDQAKCIMIRLMKDLLEEIPPHQAIAGDILLVNIKLGVSVADFLAIDGGNGKIVIATEEDGVSLWPKRFYIIKEAYRCQV